MVAVFIMKYHDIQVIAHCHIYFSRIPRAIGYKETLQGPLQLDFNSGYMLGTYNTPVQEHLP